MPKGQKLTDKERRFVEAYTGACNGNGTHAAKAAGYKGSDKVLGIQAVRTLGKARVQAAIDAFHAKREKASIATADERDEIMTQCARDAEAEWRDRTSAVKELNHVTGRHVSRVSHDVEAGLLEVLRAIADR